MLRTTFAAALFASFWCSAHSVSAQERSWQKFLTDETVFVWSHAGTNRTSHAYEQTAAYDAYHNSGLSPAFTKLWDSIPWAQMMEVSDADTVFSMAQIGLAFDHLREHGVTIAVGLPDGAPLETPPFAVVIVPDAGAVAVPLERAVRRIFNGDAPFAEELLTFDFLNNFELPSLPLLFSLTSSSTPVLIPGSSTPVYFQSGNVNSAYGNCEGTLPLQASSTSNRAVWVDSSPLRDVAVSGYYAASPLPEAATETRTTVLQPVTTVDSAPAEPEPLVAPKPEPEPIIGTLTIGARKINRAVVPMDDEYSLELAWWAEGDDLVVYYGVRPVAEYLQRLGEQEHQLTELDRWKTSAVGSKHDADADGLTETDALWLNVRRLADQFGGISLDDDDPRFTLKQILAPTGVLGLESVSFRAGYRGRNLVSAWDVQTKGPRTGVLGFYDHPTISLDDLPPLPADVTSFSAQSLDLQQAFQSGIEVFDEYLELAGPEGQLYWNLLKSQIDTGGIDFEKELLAPLGHVVVTYNDSEQEVLGWGRSIAAISVDDPQALQKNIDRWRDSVNENLSSTYRIVHRERRGHDLYAVISRESFLSPSFAVSGHWLVIGWQPQTVEAFVMRADGKLPVWNPRQISTANRNLVPDRFTQLTYSDPRGPVRLLVSLAPWAIEGARMIALAASEEGTVWQPNVNSLDIPPAEMIVESLYPNLSVTTVDEHRIHTETWSSSNADNAAWWIIGGYFGLFVLSEM